MIPASRKPHVLPRLWNADGYRNLICRGAASASDACYAGQYFPAACADGIPILLLYTSFGEELAAYAHTEGTCLKPSSQVLLLGSHTPCNHNPGPRAGSHHPFDKSRAIDISRKHLGDFATQFLCCTYFTHASASGYIGYLTAVAQSGYICIQQRTHHETGTHLDVQGSRGGVHHRAYAKCHVGTMLLNVLHAMGKHLVGKITTVGKLKYSYSSVIAGLDDLASRLLAGMIEYWYHPRSGHLGHYLQFVISCHKY